MYKLVMVVNFILGLFGMYTLQYEWYRGQFNGTYLSGQDPTALKLLVIAIVIILINWLIYSKKYKARCVLSKFSYSFIFIGSLVAGMCSELILLMIILMLS
ncbi:hypothetical protein JR334_00600 [Clostridia bacterium]|nr:hypothetical protein JR334_00600 [Clostridia bacterium]